MNLGNVQLHSKKNLAVILGNIQTIVGGRVGWQINLTRLLQEFYTMRQSIPVSAPEGFNLFLTLN